MTTQSQGNSLSRRQVAKGAAWAAPAVSFAAAAPASAASNGCTVETADPVELTAYVPGAGGFTEGDAGAGTFSFLNTAEPAEGYPTAPEVPAGTTFTVNITWVVTSPDALAPTIATNGLEAATVSVGEGEISDQGGGIWSLTLPVTFTSTQPVAPGASGGDISWGTPEDFAPGSDMRVEIPSLDAPPHNQLDTSTCTNYIVSVEPVNLRG